MRGNEVLLSIKNLGFEKGMERNVLRLAEEIEDVNKTIKEIVQAFEALTRVQTMLNGVADGLKDRMDKMGIKDDDARPTREGL